VCVIPLEEWGEDPKKYSLSCDQCSKAYPADQTSSPSQAAASEEEDSLQSQCPYYRYYQKHYIEDFEHLLPEEEGDSVLRRLLVAFAVGRRNNAR
jgi:hypothetical protein